MAGPYDFDIDREAGTWTCKNGNGDQVDSGDLPLKDIDRRLAIFSDRGVNDPTSSALEDIWKENWSDNEA